MQIKVISEEKIHLLRQPNCDNGLIFWFQRVSLCKGVDNWLSFRLVATYDKLKCSNFSKHK